MPCSALPAHLQKDPFAEGDKTDHDNPAQRWWSRCWTAFGPNATEETGWVGIPIPYTRYRIPLFPLQAKWRRFPIVLIAYNVPRWMGKKDNPAFVNFEMVNRLIWLQRDVVMTDENTRVKYQVGVSPIQKPFSFALTWPLHFVITGKKMSFRIGARWDSLDDYYVFPAAQLGRKPN